MMKVKICCFGFALFFVSGCILPDAPAQFALRQKETEKAVSPLADPLSWEQCRQMAPDADEITLHRLFVEAAAAQEEADCSSSDPAEKRRVILVHAKAKAALASALGLPPDAVFRVRPLDDLWRQLPTEPELKAVLWLHCAERKIQEPTELRSRELALHCAYLDFLAVLEECDYASTSASNAVSIRRRGHLARLKVLEAIGEKDLSRIPAILERIEKEAVREEKGL